MAVSANRKCLCLEFLILVDGCVYDLSSVCDTSPCRIATRELVNDKYKDRLYQTLVYWSSFPGHAF
jgi:hypothetical protein